MHLHLILKTCQCQCHGCFVLLCYSHWLKKMRFRAKNSTICEKVTLRANHIARISSDFKTDLINIIIHPNIIYHTYYLVTTQN